MLPCTECFSFIEDEIIWTSINILYFIVGIVFYNKLPWFVSELPEQDILNMVFQCR